MRNRRSRGARMSNRSSLLRIISTGLILSLSLSLHRTVAIPNDERESTSTREPSIHASIATLLPPLPNDGNGNYHLGMSLFQKRHYRDAAPYLWRSILHTPPQNAEYGVQEAFMAFIKCYQLRGKLGEGYTFISLRYYVSGDLKGALEYAQQARAALSPNSDTKKAIKNANALVRDLARLTQADPPDNTPDNDLKRLTSIKSAVEWYGIGNKYFDDKKHTLAAAAFEKSCEMSVMTISLACVNAVYCRTLVCQWDEVLINNGDGRGLGYEADMARIERITADDLRTVEEVWIDAENDTRSSGHYHRVYPQSVGVHPHMMLGYPVNSLLKRFVSESHAFNDESAARHIGPNEYTPLEDGLPYNHSPNLPALRNEYQTSQNNFKLKVGFVGCGFNSKAVLFLSHDMFRFFDKTKFEMHVFSLGPADHPQFIAGAMRNADWRERVKSSVDYFHDVQEIGGNHQTLAKFIEDKGMHILIEWDGYAREGSRAKGLFALRPAPIQILHQEFLGTTGATYVDYIVTDKNASPRINEHLYTEKAIYMPHHFFSKGHAVQKELTPPTLAYKPKTTPYTLGTGTPQENKCLATNNRDASFVYCNMNKFLKFHPTTVDSWLAILERVPDSILCLLENPVEGIPNIQKFVKSHPEFVSGSKQQHLVDRIHFLPWENSPFDNQRRMSDFCNVVLDSHPYNGHTTAADSLYAGVPIVTLSDGMDMGGLVTTSGNIVLGMPELNAGSYDAYTEIGVRMGLDTDRIYTRTRTRLVESCLQTAPHGHGMHPFWDVSRYTRNLERGLSEAFRRYVMEEPWDHISIVDTDDVYEHVQNDDGVPVWQEL